jgi:hypothetical protein
MTDKLLTITSDAPPTPAPLFMRLTTSDPVIRTLNVECHSDPTTVTGSTSGLAPHVTIGAEAYRNLHTLLQRGPGSTIVQLSCSGSSVFAFAAFPAGQQALRLAENVETIAGAMQQVITLLGSIDSSIKEAANPAAKAPLAALKDTGTG